MSFKKNVPEHYQLTCALREFVQNGNWNIGDLFPPDREIMEKYNVSATTVRRAVIQLVNEGWLIRKPGKGTFIVKEPIQEDLIQLTGFFEEMKSQGLHPCADILFKGPIEAGASLIKKFKAIKEFKTEELFLLEKLHKVSNKPLFYVQSFWVKEYGEQFLNYDLTVRGTYDIVANEMGIYLSKADETIRAGLASEIEAKYLQVKKGFPVLIMERLVFVEEKLVEFSYNVARADQYSYHVIRMPKGKQQEVYF